MPEKSQVLIVEDNDFVRMQIVSYLKADGYGTLEASDGDQALDVMAREPDIAMVLADLRMEPMGGFEFIRSLRTNNSTLPVILVTGDQTPDILEQAGKLGIAAVLMKPVEKTRLIGTVSRAMKGHGRG
jgi:CheY-like chemotaxis protein